MLSFARFIKDEVIGRRFVTLDVDYKGIRFPITGPAGDFAQSIQTYGIYEPGLMERVLDVTSDGMIVLDVGAAEGFFTVFMSNIPNKKVDVVAFDDDDSRLRLFKRNTARATTTPARLIKSFVGDGNRDGVPSLDTLTEKHQLGQVDMIKLDVEGEEIFVLPGATQVIERHRPHVFAEIHPPKIASIDKNGNKKLLDWLAQIAMPIWLCTNHRGNHRGPVEPWRKITVDELGQYLESDKWKTVGNFYIHLDPREA